MSDAKILVLGVSGMLGSATFRTFCEADGFEVVGTSRNARTVRAIAEGPSGRLITNVDVLDQDRLASLFLTEKPDLVINCVGLVKQLLSAEDPLVALPINSLFPHRLARLCGVAGARLVHISTDCVFSGEKGNYIESDPADALDLYGRSKHLGETVTYPNAITLRTSIIGRELTTAHSLVDWFLAQTEAIQGFTRAIFSGLPTDELARVIRDFVFPRPELSGLYHISAAPISKFDLLRLVAQAYGKEIEIEPSERLVIDRSLNSTRFSQATGYMASPWPDLIQTMHAFDHMKGN